MSIRLSVTEPAEGLQILEFEVQCTTEEQTGAKSVWDYFPTQQQSGPPPADEQSQAVQG